MLFPHCMAKALANVIPTNVSGSDDVRYAALTMYLDNIHAYEINFMHTINFMHARIHSGYLG